MNLTVTLWRDDLFSLQAFQADGTTPRPLVGCQVFFGARNSPTDPLLIAAGINAGITITDINLGKFDLALGPIAKIGLNPLVSPYWDVLVIDVTGRGTTPPGLSGRLTVESGVMPPPFAVVPAAPTNGAFLPTIVALTGGTATSLDSVPTFGLAKPHVVTVSIDDDLRAYKLRARDGADPLPASGDPRLGDTFIYPIDYDADTNDVVWVQVS